MTKEWIEWKGGECPVPAGTLVDLRYRHNYCEDRIAVPALTFGNMSDREFWQHESYAHAYDIIAWRLHQPEQPAWNGEGQPPVGCECEREVPHGWARCRINYVSNALIVYQMLETGNEYASTLSAFRFRPISTETERKRELACKAMTDRIEMDNCLAELIYDDIAAGKIPGVKLDS